MKHSDYKKVIEDQTLTSKLPIFFKKEKAVYKDRLSYKIGIGNLTVSLKVILFLFLILQLLWFFDIQCQDVINFLYNKLGK